MITEKNVLAEHTHDRSCSAKRISWTAIIAGAFVGLGISFLFYVFGAAIGLSAFKSTQTGIYTLALGGFLGSVIAAIVSMFVGGWISGYLACMGYGCRECNNSYTEEHDKNSCGNIGALYGFITWVLTLIVTILLAADVSSYISSRYYMASNPTAAIISTTTNPEAPMVRETQMGSGVNAQTQMTINEEKATNVAGNTLFALFVIFFVGALASCVGGYLGISFRCNHNVQAKRLNTTNTTTPRV